MTLFEIILLGIALGIDCLIVSFSQGLIYRNDRMKNAALLALTMGLFQGLMPLVGFKATSYIHYMLEPFANGIVFAIFMLLGLQFILQSMNKDYKEEQQCISLRCLISLGVATSIDALVSGVTLDLTFAPIVQACIIVGLTSILMSLGGFYATDMFKNCSRRKLQLSGGLILIFLAVKVFWF